MNEPRIRWDDSEQRKVAAESFRIIQSNTSIHKMQAIELAQKKVLKPNRRRELTKTHFGQLKWIEPLWAEIENEKHAQAKAAANDLFTPPAEPEVAAGPEPQAEAADAPAVSITQPAEPLTPEPETPSRKHVVHWTDDEKHTLAFRASYLLKSFQDMKPIEALRKSIDSELPAERQREIATLSQVEWFIPTIDEIRAAEAAEAQRLKEQAEIEARVAAETAERIEREARAREEEIERRVSERVNGLSFDDLLRTFARKIARDALGYLREELQGGMGEAILDAATAPAPTPAPPMMVEEPAAPQVGTPAAPVKLRKVMVVGLHPNGEQEIERAFRGVLEFDFVKSTKHGGTGEGGHAMLRRSPGCEVVVAMADMMGLDVVQKRKQLAVPFTQIAGSSSSLKRWLGMFVNGQVELMEPKHEQ